MPQLKIYTFGTKYFIDTYSQGLREDCKAHDYDLTVEVIPDAENFSHINHHIHLRMVEVVRNASSNDRILFLDPECRIVKPIPQDWMDDARPLVCYKIQHGKQDIERYTYGHTLPGPIQMQPIFLSASDITWIQWWYDASMAASDPANSQYTPHELFLELALKFNKIDMHKEHCVYNREFTGKHCVVKGSWTTDDTIIKHPDIHAMLDPNVKNAVPEIKNSKFLPERKLHNHFTDLDTVKQIDALMFKEVHDITKWPEGTVAEGEWYVIDDWMFDPKLGRLGHKDFESTKYHFSLEQKIERGINTPAVKNFTKQSTNE